MSYRRAFWMLGAVVIGAISFCVLDDDCTLLTPDQRAHRSFLAEDYEAAAGQFSDLMWQGVALYRQKEFEQAAGVFAGFDTPEGAFNQGNALVFLGKYDDAIARYDRALELRPEWAPAEENRAIAVARAALLKQEGGEGTGGMLAADEIVFSDQKSSSAPEEEEQTDGGEQLSAEEMRAIWLRQVQTKPADFLRSKFAYQYGTREGGSK